MASTAMPAMAGWRATHLVCCLAKIERTAAGVVQQSIQCHKSPPGTACGRREGSIRWQTAVQTSREDCRAEATWGLPCRRHVRIAVQTPRKQNGNKDKPARASAADRGSVLPIAPKRHHFYVARLELNWEAPDSRESAADALGPTLGVVQIFTNNESPGCFQRGANTPG
jgi:hypothetical protein